jgi:predicted alpha/beta-hydrolase family hydrolase
MRTRLALIIPLCFAFATLAHAGDMSIVTPRGVTLRAVVSFPRGAGPFPTIVLAPGAGYHMALPIMEEAARQFVDRGIATVRFDWGYFSAEPKGRPSKDLELEAEDMKAVLESARRDARVDKGKLFVGGKSLGSGVAWKLLAADKSVRGAVLLTPVCSSTKDGVVSSDAEENYPGIAQEKRPLLFVMGEQDPYCAASLLYRYAGTAAGAVRVDVIGGDHGLGTPGLSGEADEAVKQRNARIAAQLMADFVAARSSP